MAVRVAQVACFWIAKAGSLCQVLTQLPLLRYLLRLDFFVDVGLPVVHSPRGIGGEERTLRRLLPHLVKVLRASGRTRGCCVWDMLLVGVISRRLILIGGEVLLAIALHSLRYNHFARKLRAP